ncbi:LuxR C-terminal-related transcriptional regulator [Isoptericola sp. NPDC056573]|uniref:helix-turn-helix transcriptional regulator n=1 Tax=Isoptericola sp. NPDC056573 TaxID=3345868 RepID=UPI003674F00A
MATGPELLHRGMRDGIVRQLQAGTSVEIVGLPGSGRSTLAGAVAAALEDAGWTVLRVYGVRVLQNRPLEVLALAGLVPRSDARSSSAVAVASAQLEAALAPHRAVLVIDDVDAIDETSAGVVAATHARHAFPILTTSRPRRGAHLIPGVDLQPATRVTLSALGLDALQDLVAGVLPGSVSASLTGRLFTMSGGLPRLALAMLSIAQRRGDVRQDHGTWHLDGDLFSLELAPALEPFLDGLGAHARSAIETLAVAGTLPVATARDLTSTEALAELEAAGLLRYGTRGEDLVVGLFPHAVAEYLRHVLPRIRRFELDERLGAVRPEGRPAPIDRPLPVRLPLPSTLVDPFLSGEGPEEAGTVLNRLFAEEWYRSTLTRRHEWEAGPSPKTAIPYIRTLVIGAADSASVHAVIDATPPGDDPVWRTRWTIWCANVAAEVDDDLSGALATLAVARATAGDLAPWLEAEERRLRILHDRVPFGAQELDAPAVPEVARQTVERVETQRRLASADADGALAWDAASAPGQDVEQTVWSGVVRGVALVSAGRHDEALKVSRALLERGRAELDPDVIHGHGYVVSLALFLGARMSELHTHLGTVLSTGLRPTLHRQFEAGNRSVAAALAAMEGRRESASVLVQQAYQQHGTLGPYPFTTPTWAAGLLDTRAHGESTDSRRRAADDLWAEAQTLFGRGAILAGSVAGSLAVDFAVDAERLATLDSLRSSTSSGLVSALVQLAHASDATAEEAFDIGRQLVTEGQVLLGARAFAHAAGRVQDTGDATAVRRTLAEARELVRRHGGEPGAIVRPVDRAVGLTPRERQLASLVSAGTSNEEIARQLHLSVRTVQNTLGRVVAKLGVDSRNELTPDLLGT